MGNQKIGCPTGEDGAEDLNILDNPGQTGESNLKFVNSTVLLKVHLHDSKVCVYVFGFSFGTEKV